MAGFDDAIAAQRAKMAESQRGERALAEQSEWAKAQGLTIVRRYVESLRLDGRRPMTAEVFTYKHEYVKRTLTRFPRRLYTDDCHWTTTGSPAGDAWLIAPLEWVTETPVRGGQDEQSAPGRDVFGVVVYSPESDSLRTAVMPNVTQRVDGYGRHLWADLPAFQRLINERRVYLRGGKVLGVRCGCFACKRAVPDWHSRYDAAGLELGNRTKPQLQIGPDGRQRYTEGPAELVPEDERLEVLLGKAIRKLDNQLQTLGVPWAPA